MLLENKIRFPRITYTRSIAGLLLLSLVTILTTGLYSIQNHVFGQMMSDNMGGMSSMGGGGMPGMGGGSMGMGGMSSMGGGGMPGTLNQMCHMGNDMPPHYCEPSYHVMSSVQGVKVSAVSPLSNNSLSITLQQLNTISSGSS